jgi:hypothetical protein
MDIRSDNIPCKIDGMGRLFLTLSGMCIPQPISAEVLKFSTPVRVPESKGIPVTNRSNISWHISPIIDNSFWTGQEFLDIEPGQTKTYDIVFNPLETVGTGEGGKHEGSIFFPLPDGTGMLYRLNGVANQPLPNGTINRELPCKTQFTEIVSVSNWLRRSQRFKVIVDFGKQDPGVIFKGHEYWDLAPLQTKEYKFSYFAYKEGVTNLKLIFRNEINQEYVFYNINYRNLPAGIISTIDITSPIRQLQTRELTVCNPLTIPALFNCSSNHPEITVSHSFTIQPK